MSASTAVFVPTLFALVVTHSCGIDRQKIDRQENAGAVEPPISTAG
jgi:hypothetical protein